MAEGHAEPNKHVAELAKNTCNNQETVDAPAEMDMGSVHPILNFRVGFANVGLVMVNPSPFPLINGKPSPPLSLQSKYP